MISGYPLRYWWLGASATLMIIGSFGPWVRALFVTASGLDGDGWITLIVGVAAVVATFVFARSSVRPRPWWPLAVCIVAAVIGVAVTLNIWIDIESADELNPASEDNPFDLGADELVSVEWGLILTFAASISLAAAAAANWVRNRGVLEAPADLRRECPHCKEPMRRDASVCPHCRRESDAWVFENSLWWSRAPSGDWQVRDEASGAWRTEPKGD